MKRLTIIIVLFLMINSCSKDNQQQAVPYVTVNFTEYLSAYPYSKLQTPGNWLYVKGGSKGIIIYRIGINVNGSDPSNDFIVFDRNCTYEPLNANAIVSVQSNNTTVIDSSCGSRFYISTGSVINGPATLQLKTYHYSYDAASMQLDVFN